MTPDTEPDFKRLDTTIRRRPDVHCVECGSAGADALCSRCTDAVCKEHDKQSRRPWWRAAVRRMGIKNLPQWLRGRETVRHYCPTCAGPRNGFHPEFAGAPVTLGVGAAVLSESTALGYLLLTVGAVRTLLLIRLVPWRSGHEAVSKLRLYPSIRSTGVIEDMSGHVVLDPTQGFSSTSRPATGELSVEAAFSAADREQVRRFRAKHPALWNDTFSAGSLLLLGNLGLQFPATTEVQIENARKVVLDGRTAQHSFLGRSASRDRGSWHIKLPYEVSSPTTDESWAMPAWLTPGIVPESDMRALELEIQWADLGPEKNPLKLQQIDLLQVKVPASWGPVLHSTRQVATGVLIENRLRSIEWKHLTPPTADRRLHLSLRFENQITLNSVLVGELRMTFDGALSGIKQVKAFDATGSAREVIVPRRPRTQVHTTFELSLAGLRYQAVQVRRGELGHFDVIPDHITVAHLTDTLGKDDYYIKRVIENPPRGSRRANIINRYWDIAGRLYDGIYPIDVHIILTGEEEHDGQPRASRGRAHVRVVVQGAYANESMRRKVDAAFEALRYRVRSALAQEPHVDPVQVVDDNCDATERRADLHAAVVDLRRTAVESDYISVEQLRTEILEQIDDNLLPLLTDADEAE